MASDVDVPYDTSVIPVTSPNAYTNPTFCDTVQDADTIILAGVSTESCDRNQHVVVVRDAVSGHGLAAWFALVVFQMAYGRVVRVP